MVDRQWFAHGVSVYETGETEYFAEGVAISQDQVDAGTIDTKDKRMSAMNLAIGMGACFCPLPDTDASVDDADKQHLLGTYSAIAFDAAAGGNAMPMAVHIYKMSGAL